MAVEIKSDDSELFLEKEILSPYIYLLQVKGKQMRLRISLALNYWLNVPDEKLREILSMVHMLHVGSLLIDDIQDDTKVRRGMPAAHCVFGVPLTINASMHILALVYERAYKLSPKAAEILMEQFLSLCRGQGRDIYWREKFLCPTEDQYQIMIEKKTGGMFLLTLRLLQFFSKNKTDFSKLMSSLGRYFQIRDDYCNLTKQEVLEETPAADEGKVYKSNSHCDDITEGKFSLSVIHAMKTDEADEILEILRKRTEDLRLKKRCVSLLDRAGSLQYTRDKLEQFDRDMRDEVARLGGNPLMEDVLDDLLNWRS